MDFLSPVFIRLLQVYLSVCLWVDYWLFRTYFHEKEEDEDENEEEVDFL